MNSAVIYTPYGHSLNFPGIDPPFLILSGGRINITRIPIANQTIFFDKDLDETERMAESLEVSNYIRKSLVFRWRDLICSKLYSDQYITILQVRNVTMEEFQRDIGHSYDFRSVQPLPEYISDNELYIYAYIHNDMAPSDIARNWFDPDFDNDEEICTEKAAREHSVVTNHLPEYSIPIVGCSERDGVPLAQLTLSDFVNTELGFSSTFRVRGRRDFPNAVDLTTLFLIAHEEVDIDMKKVYHTDRAIIMYGHGTCTATMINDEVTKYHDLFLWLITYESI